MCAYTSTRKSTGHQLESLSIFKSLNTSSLKSTKSFYALRQSFLGYPEGRCFTLSFEILFKILLEILEVDDWLYSGRNGRGLGLAVKTASPSCTGISASPKVSLSAFPLLLHFKNSQQDYYPSNVVWRSKAAANLGQANASTRPPPLLKKPKRKIFHGIWGAWTCHSQNNSKKSRCVKAIPSWTSSANTKKQHAGFSTLACHLIKKIIFN